MTPDLAEQLDRVFALAQERGLNLDFHTDESFNPEDVTLRYSGVRGKYASRCQKDTDVVVIDPDLHKIFPDSESVNCALRQYAEEHRISQA